MRYNAFNMAADEGCAPIVRSEVFVHPGKWHIIQWTVLSLSQIMTSFISMNILVIGFQPKFRCFIPEMYRNKTFEDGVFNDQCELTDSIANHSSSCPFGYEYQGGKNVSFVSEWDLVCDRGYMGELTQTLYLIGMAFGAIVISHIADRLGRKPMLIITGTLQCVSFAAVTFIPTYIWFLALRFLHGFFCLGHYDVKIVLMMEIFPARMRGNVIILDGLLWGVGITVLAGLGYAFDGLNWRHVQLMMLPPFVVIIAYFFLIDESIRWLIANGKYKKAQKIQEKIAKMNRYKPKPVVAGEDSVFMFDQQLPVLPEGEIPTEKHSQAQDTDVVVKYNVFGILKHKKSRFLLIGMCFVWFTNSLIYLGLFMMTTAMSGDRLLNVLLSAAVEIPAMGGTYVCSRWFGRRRGCIALHATCAVALFLALTFSLTTEGRTNDILMKMVSVVGKFAISASFIMIYLYTPELLPTNFRAAGLGISSGCARIGSIMAPFSSYVFRKAAWAPGAVFGSLSLLVSIYLLFVPETRHRELPQTLADIDLWFTTTGPETDVIATDQKCVEPISENTSDTSAVGHASDKRKL